MQYKDNGNFALHMRMITALAFAPTNDLIASDDMVSDEIRLQFGDVADDILEYFEDTYIGRYRRIFPRRPPMTMNFLVRIITWKDGIDLSNVTCRHVTLLEVRRIIKEGRSSCTRENFTISWRTQLPPQRPRYAACAE